VRCRADVEIGLIEDWEKVVGGRVRLVDAATGKNLLEFDADTIRVEGNKIILPTITVLPQIGD